MAVDTLPASPTALGGLNRLSAVRQIILLAAVAGTVALGSDRRPMVQDAELLATLLAACRARMLQK